MGSVWSKTCRIGEREPLHGDIKTEVAVIGAGMAGMLIADRLREAGRGVIVLEAGRIGGGQTCNTTAKLTSQHGLIYSRLVKTHGSELARQYAMANESALESLIRLIEERGIDCELEHRHAYVYGNDVKALSDEAACAASLGLPASYTEDVPLPFPTAGAVCFAHQAQFHPLKLLKAVSEELTVYENTPVTDAEEHRLVTPGGTVKAEKIVFACHYPFVDIPGFYFARMHQERSYVLALENADGPDGMWFFAPGEENAYSFRRWRDMLLLGGGGHRCGENSAGGRYDELAARAAQWFPGCREIARWSAQDCMTADGVPYIGRYAVSRPDWYVATGFAKWGMTTSMAAAQILSDLITGEDNPYAEVFDPGRFGAETLTGVVSEGGHAIGGLAKRFFAIPDTQAGELPKEHGGIVQRRGEKRGVYKDGAGAQHAVEPHCTHMGCQLEWNPDEKSWDCPCHGSRFDSRGRLINGPAQKDLEKAE